MSDIGELAQLALILKNFRLADTKDFKGGVNWSRAIMDQIEWSKSPFLTEMSQGFWKSQFHQGLLCGLWINQGKTWFWWEFQYNQRGCWCQLAPIDTKNEVWALLHHILPSLNESYNITFKNMIWKKNIRESKGEEGKRIKWGDWRWIWYPLW